ncbi:hypothetical protein [Gracilinema caldarium]|uniref:OmpA family protein n=1 Tax=Gracilinema caldarium (strain ATCC 51460 / DSM 7334 / H1) TaxID=744872 RepID=F8F3N6_GRAC1|nr:hypothetical protein [Gracilinema caldarium]AEJ19980.1 OmpA family protein [Gracilinema caldarium DSM 7334]
MNMKIEILSLFICIGFNSILSAQSESAKFSIEPVLQWHTMEIVSTVKLDMNSAGLQLPTGRAHGEELLDVEFPRIISPYLFTIPIDSTTTIEIAIQQGQLSILDIDKLVRTATKFPTILDLTNNSLNRKILVPLQELLALLVRHHVPATLPHPLVTQTTKVYTGVIIFAQERLPIYGRQDSAYLRPCLFPKVWDTEGTLVYERNMVSPEIAKTRGIAKYTTIDQVLQQTPSGISPYLQELVGDRPLKILADKIYGKLPTDPVISKDDAIILYSSDNNRRLLTEGRVVIVLAPELLIQTFTFSNTSSP